MPRNTRAFSYIHFTQYVDGLITDFDLLVIGGYLNRKRTAINKFVLGVAAHASHGQQPQMHACTTVVQGLQHADFRAVNAALRPHWNHIERWSRRAEPQPLEYGAAKQVRFGRGGVPDVWIEPQSSLVMQVLAAELVPSRTQATAQTMRFPRIQRLRPEKRWSDVCRLEEWNELCKVSAW